LGGANEVGWKVHPSRLNDHNAFGDINAEDSVGEVVQETFGLVGEKDEEVFDDCTGDHKGHFKEYEITVDTHAIDLMFFALFFGSAFDKTI